MHSVLLKLNKNSSNFHYQAHKKKKKKKTKPGNLITQEICEFMGKQTHISADSETDTNRIRQNLTTLQMHYTLPLFLGIYTCDVI